MQILYVTCQSRKMMFGENRHPQNKNYKFYMSSVKVEKITLRENRHPKSKKFMFYRPSCRIRSETEKGGRHPQNKKFMFYRPPCQILGKTEKGSWHPKTKISYSYMPIFLIGVKSALCPRKDSAFIKEATKLQTQVPRRRQAAGIPPDRSDLLWSRQGKDPGSSS